MSKFFPILGLLALAACSGDGGGGGGGGPTVDNPIPEELGRNLESIAYDADTNKLTVAMFSLDSSPVDVVYKRNKALDVNGYSAFSVQEDPLDRMFIALVAESADGKVEAAAVADGGQFNRFFSGTYYARIGSASIPTTGQVSYAGKYAGISNLPADGDNLLPVPGGTDPELIPGEARRTRGDIFMNVNFDDNAVNGSIYNRRFVDGERLPSLDLVVPLDDAQNLDENGEFLGDVEFSGRPDEGAQGIFGGIIGGTDGADMAGVIYLDNIFLSDDARDSQFDSEVGVFVLPRCGTPGDPPICDDVKP